MNITEKIAAAGVVGCGGAGFPTHAKLRGTIEHLIVNGAECEPLLRTDRYIMVHKAQELISALLELKEQLSIPRCTIALKGSYHEELAALRQAIQRAGAEIQLHELAGFYPAGDEQTITYEVTGRVVPPAGIPMAVGVVVDNVATILAVHDALEGRPLTHKYLTVTGEVRHPVVLHVPIGTAFTQCLELAGGPSRSRYVVVAGGPMMGRPLSMEAAAREVVTKTTSGILVLPEDGYHAGQSGISPRHMLNRARSACIQCSACTQLCPRRLLGHPLQPHKIMRKMALCQDVDALLDDPVIQSAQLCCECGVCEVYACPMGLQPRRINSLLKQRLGAAGFRYASTPEVVCTPDGDRALRKVPSRRLAARVGVLPYDSYDVKELVEDEPEQVSLPLKMHIGAPAVPIVAPGDSVTCGQQIAVCPDSALGSHIHASISGQIVSVGDVIVIHK